jgi:hypothetical protein
VRAVESTLIAEFVANFAYISNKKPVANRGR